MVIRALFPLVDFIKFQPKWSRMLHGKERKQTWRERERDGVMGDEWAYASC